MTAVVTPDQEGLRELADELSKARGAYLDAIGRGPGGEVERRKLQQLLWDDKSTIINAICLATKPAEEGVREAAIAAVNAYPVASGLSNYAHEDTPDYTGYGALRDLRIALGIPPALSTTGKPKP